jgi:hypothetical protein
MLKRGSHSELVEEWAKASPSVSTGQYDHTLFGVVNSSGVEKCARILMNNVYVVSRASTTRNVN